MGTRADFYVGKGVDAEWIGSIAMDGYPARSESSRAGIPWRMFRLTSESNWREAVAQYIAAQSHGTTTADGWPWPWESSHTTDYSYTFADGKVFASSWGHEWHDPIERAEMSDEERERVEDSETGKVPFPNMSNGARPTLGPRSGLIVLRGA